MTDWDVIRMQYEVFEAPVEQIARENMVEPGLIEYAIEHEHWERKPLPDSKDADDLVVAVQDRVSKMNVMKMVALNPMYIELETAILSKAKKIVKGLSAELPTSSDQLKKVAEVLSLLSVRSGLTAEGGGSGDDNRVVVQIMNQAEVQQATPTLIT